MWTSADIRRANETGENPLDLINSFCQVHLTDMADLQCLPPTHQPCVSDHMEQIKDMITQIISDDCGYLVDGDVFFAVDKISNYGCLLGQKLENQRAGERVAVDSRKRNPADFALWKAAKPGEPSWGNSWGLGRPGWHIECSAMSAYYLPFKFDIHGGGIDLIFPHHENEITQSRAACQESCVSYWMHNGHVTHNNEKMSKSLGNFSQSVRVATPSEGTEPKGKTVRVLPDAKKCIKGLRKGFHDKMVDDLNTSHVLTDSAPVERQGIDWGLI